MMNFTPTERSDMTRIITEDRAAGVPIEETVRMIQVMLSDTHTPMMHPIEEPTEKQKACSHNFAQGYSSTECRNCRVGSCNWERFTGQCYACGHPVGHG